MSGNLHVFDLDNTLVEGALVERAYRSLLSKGVLRIPDQELENINSMMDVDYPNYVRAAIKAYDKGVRGVPLRTLEYDAEEIAEVDSTRIYPIMQSIVDQLKADGQKVILLSGSPEVYVSEFGRALGATHALGSRHYVSLGRVELSPPYEDITKNKHIELKYLMSRMGGIAMGAYGDSIHDVNFLEMANTPFAVNPDPKLRQYALNKDWDIIDVREIQDDQS